MSYEPPIHDPRHDEDFYREQAEGDCPASVCYAVVEPKTGITVSITKKPKVSESGVITDDTGFKWYGHKLEEIPSHNSQDQEP